MTALPAVGNLDGSTPSHNEGMFQAAIAALHGFCSGLFGSDGTAATALATLRMLDPSACYNVKPTFAMGSNALTISVTGNAATLSATNPAFLAQRSATLGDGGFNLRTLVGNPTNLVVSAGSTLGHASARLCPVYIHLLDISSSVQEIAVSGTFQGEAGIITTVAEGGGGGADTATTMYSASVRSNVSFRLIAIAWFNNTTAGNWVNAATEIKQRPFHLETVGEVVAYGGGTVPHGFFLMDGSNQTRATFAKLFGKIGTSFGVGDGSTTFGIGDSRRRALVGSGGSGTGTLGNAVGNSGGAETHTLSSGEVPATAVTLTNLTLHNTDGQPGASPAAVDPVANSVVANMNRVGNTGNYANAMHTFTANVAGSGGAHNNLQPSLVVTQMIRWLGDL